MPTTLPSRHTRQSLAVLAVLLWCAIPAHGQVAGPITVYPQVSSLEVTSTQQFTAYVPISPNTVVWFVNGIAGGNSAIGAISATGFYTPPAVIPTSNVVTVSAKSTAFPAQIGNATLTITRPSPSLWSATPATLVVGNYSVTFNGANFAPDSQVLANGVAVLTTYKSPTSLVATGAAPQAGALTFAVRQPAPGAVTGNSVTVQVKTAIVGVSVAPSAVSVTLGKSQAFTANVTGTVNTAVTWSVNNVVGGDAVNGTITAGGVYLAPAAMPAASVVTIRANSSASPGTIGQATVTLLAPITVSVSPPSATVGLGTAQTFVATLTGNANTGVTWSVNGITGGSASIGTVTTAGLYTAPAVMPVPATMTIRAASVVSASSFAQAAVTLVPPVTVKVAPTAATVRLGDTQTFVATVTGTANTAVTWTVDGVPGGSSAAGTISDVGVYTPPALMPSSTTVTVGAVSAAASASAQAAVTLAPALPLTSSLADARFLEQASFGPSPQSLAHLHQLGTTAWLDEQFTMPETQIPLPADNNMGTLRAWMLYNYSAAPDQLRQKVAYALSQIIVTSGNKLVYPDENIPWLQALSSHAFGNYRDLLREVTTSPSMGKYLDLARSAKPSAVSGANENYPRELMQLFTIGLWQMNQDGSYVKDASGNQVSTYDQQTVGQVALALTGWTYATNAYEYFGAPMVPNQANHDMTAKSFLGCSVAGGQSVDQDLDALLDCLMQHPNMAPFIATRLIRLLVMSNPSPGYIKRVADVFAGAAGGTRGDLKATITAILMDPEARQDTPATANAGRLKDAIGQTVGLVRALGGQFGANNQITYLFDYMSQSILTPPSVFSWFSPMYRVPNSPSFGPEFQIYSQTDATLRGNFMFTLLGGGVNSPLFQKYGNDTPGLVEAANQTLLYGRMPAAMKQALITAATPGYDPQARITTVLYLTALSGFYAIQY
jgi:uncharacterized protein (DUF1800 family)